MTGWTSFKATLKLGLGFPEDPYSCSYIFLRSPNLGQVHQKIGLHHLYFLLRPTLSQQQTFLCEYCIKRWGAVVIWYEIVNPILPIIPT